MGPGNGRRWLLRALIVLCVAGALVLWRLDWRRTHPPDVQVFDLAERARRLAAGSPQADSLADWYYDEAGGSAHLHVFGKGITCQLHIHEHTEEATIPVMGRPVVTQRFAVDGALAARTAQYDEGTMVVSPPYCAHEWVNASKGADHASLVFTLGDSFPGNTFVRADDPRILKGGAPSTFDAHAELASFAESSERLREIAVPVTLGSISEVLVKDSFVVDAVEKRATFVYAVAGEGYVDGTRERITLEPETLVVVRSALRLSVVASPGKPLAIFVVRIEKKP